VRSVAADGEGALHTYARHGLAADHDPDFEHARRTLVGVRRPSVVYGADVVLPIIDFGQDSAWHIGSVSENDTECQWKTTKGVSGLPSNTPHASGGTSVDGRVRALSRSHTLIPRAGTASPFGPAWADLTHQGILDWRRA
jgi:hypothetical protein